MVGCVQHTGVQDSLESLEVEPVSIECIELRDGETKQITGDLSLIRCGGHFDGGTVLHWPGGADGRGASLSGNIIQAVPD